MSSLSIPFVPFYFIRHGETDWNREQRTMGQTDIPLNERGVRQAHEVSSYVQNLEIERIVSSPLLRAKQTAEIMSTYLSLPLELHEDLKEVYWGENQGQIVNEKQNLEKWISGVTPRGAESCRVFQQRVTKAFSEILNTNKNTLVVAHNGVYWALMNALGYPNSKALNCIPYFFRPPEQPTHPWLVCALGEE